MNLERYKYFTNDYQAYGFYSEGPKGRIKKLMIFTKVPDTEPPIYNLVFGDTDLVTGKLDDRVISNNEDRDVVLATVANTIATFCDHYDNHYIYGEGSTPSRTRLYEMGIASLWAMQATLKSTLACAISFSSTDLRVDIKAINVPTLIIHGDSDQAVPIKATGEQASKMIPNAEHIVYEGGTTWFVPDLKRQLE